jgi:hypothetical protein
MERLRTVDLVKPVSCPYSSIPVSLAKSHSIFLHPCILCAFLLSLNPGRRATIHFLPPALDPRSIPHLKSAAPSRIREGAPCSASLCTLASSIGSFPQVVTLERMSIETGINLIAHVMC